MTSIDHAARARAVPPAPAEPARPAPEGRSLAACPVHTLREKLRLAGLRPTRQRVSLGWLLFAKGDRHVSAEMLFEEARAQRVNVSLATVYNTLHQFTGAGLLREIALDGAKTYFDTNPSDHHHFFIESEDRMIDVPSDAIEVRRLPALPDGMEIARIEVIVRLKPKAD
jgi:Fur family iron response transcriptional regulator